MLAALKITNFALIDELELTFSSGLNVLTGETGAGKSIILDAIDVALGGKVSNRMIRTGAQRALVEASFEVNPTVEAWLATQEIELDDEFLVCSRELNVNKDSVRSRCRLNGIIVNQQQLHQLRPLLLEITAQGQTVQLLISERQRELLDAYGGNLLLTQRQTVTSAYHHWQQAKKLLEEHQANEKQRLQRWDLMQYQLQELTAAQLTEVNELELLEGEKQRLSHVVELQQLSYQTYQILYQNDSEQPAVADLLAKAESLMNSMCEYDKELNPLLEMVRSALTQVVEAGKEINAYGDSLEAEPERLTEVEERIRLLKQICRKYGPTLRDAIAFYEKLSQELHHINQGTQSLEELEKQCQQTHTHLRCACARLTASRQDAAARLDAQLLQELKPLAMAKVRFECRVAEIAPSITGADQVVFYFSSNPGEELQPLSETASGGEMSRFLLALKACLSDTEKEVGTLIFDEIDVGVSGKVAQAIAEKLHHLTHRHQILCVTHQPLVAAMADKHLRVEKETLVVNGSEISEIRTVVRVSELGDHQTRRDELALLTGGHSADEAIAFAQSLLTKAAAKKEKK